MGKERRHPRPLFARTIIEMEKGVDTKYPGGGDFLRNYASQLPLKKEEENKAVETAKEAVEKGWAAGPFELPPFPNGKQAIVTKLFTIPKHKWVNDGRLRLIFHKSYPLGLSINSERDPQRDFKIAAGRFFLSKRPRNHLNLSWFLKWGRNEDIPAPLFARTIIEIEKGVATDYPGGGFIFLGLTHCNCPSKRKTKQ